MTGSVARLQFLTEIRQPPERLSLAKAALYLAQEEYPTLESDRYLHQLDQMAAAVAAQMPDPPYPLRILKTLNQYLYDELGFRGNETNYYDPRNSYLNEVLDRRTGIPITLALVYLELAQRVQFPMVGVGFPGHFLIRPMVNEMAVWVDPFHQGEILFQEDCLERLQQMYGRSIEWRSQFVEAVTPYQFLARMLTNLKHIHLSRQELPKALADIERILLLYPDAATERRDRGLVCYQLGRWEQAIEDLHIYLQAMPGAEDAPMVQQLINRIMQP